MLTKDNLFSYAKSGDIDGIDDCLNSAIHVNSRNTYNATALYFACMFGHVKAVEFIIESGANLFLETDSGRTALDVAYLNEHSDVIAILVHHGAEKHLPPEILPKASNIVVEEPETEWFKQSPFLIFRNAIQPGKFVMLRRIYARIKHIFS
jgi:ankyrin repeat protein